MSARKSERLMNLLITLLVSRGYVTKQRLREVIPDYKEAPSEDAFERMFDRDKDDLRALGVPIEVGGYDALFDDEQGYRVVRAAFELPEITFEADEAAVIGLAARVWQQAGLASATSDALLKLTAAGVEVDREALNVAQPQLAPDEPSFEAFWEAVSTRRVVRFDYRGSASAEPSERHVQPWGIVSYRSRWYVVGHDLDREDQRMFRLSRVVGRGAPGLRRGRLHVPEGTDIREPGRPPGPGERRAHRRAAGPARQGARAAPPGRGGDHARTGRVGPVGAALRTRGDTGRRGVGPRPRRRRRWHRTTCAPSSSNGCAPWPVPMRCRMTSAGARDQVTRLLALVPYLRARESVPVQEAAREFGVSAATIRRDIGVLMFCGLPGLGMGDLIEVDFDALEGEDVIRLSNADYLARPLRLDSTEAAALVVGLRSLLEGSGDDQARGGRACAAQDRGGGGRGGRGRRPGRPAGRRGRPRGVA